jgi:hypothetical protein
MSLSENSPVVHHNQLGATVEDSAINPKQIYYNVQVMLLTPS